MSFELAPPGYAAGMDQGSEGDQSNASTRRAYAGFPAEVTSAARARSFVVGLCRSWGVPAAAPDAEIVVTELVENAVRHSRSACDVTVELATDTLTIGVGDHGHQPPRLQRPAPDVAGGRGLLLVDNVSRRWGFAPTLDGKVVWADVPVG